MDLNKSMYAVSLCNSHGYHSSKIFFITEMKEKGTDSCRCFIEADVLQRELLTYSHEDTNLCGMTSLSGLTSGFLG